MLETSGKIYFVLTLRGDRGPVDREGVAALVCNGETLPTDQVRNAFGRSLGTVADVLAHRERGPNSDRTPGDVKLPRDAVRKPTSASFRLSAVIAMVVAVVVVLIVAVIVSLNAPHPRAPDVQPAQPIQAIQSGPTQQVPTQEHNPPPSVPAQPVVHVQPIRAAVVPPIVNANAHSQFVAKPEPLTTAPAGWFGYDIGGSSQGVGPDVFAGKWTIQGMGRLLWTTEPDICRLGATTLTGDGMITAHLLSVAPGYTGIAGVMLRDGARADGLRVLMCQAASSANYGLDVRVKLGAASNSAHATVGDRVLRWLRLMRRGTAVSAWLSDDGRAWRQYGATRIFPSFSGPLLAGIVIACAPKYSQVQATAVFSDVTVVPLEAEAPGK